MNGDLKQTFILKAVNDYIEDCEKAFALLIRRYKIGKSDELLKSFRHRAATSGKGAVGELIFREYGRFIDMGVGRGHPLGGLQATKVALQSKKMEGLALVKDKTRKPKKFYSPVIYGKLTYLQNRLLYGYTEQTIEMLKREMK